MLKRSLILLFSLALLTQCEDGTDGSYRRAARILERADTMLATYRDDAAWAKASAAERIARGQGYADLLCKSLLIKGKVCDYANISEASNRDDEALGYLYEAVSLADAHELMPEKVTTRYIISEVYVNKNRWKAAEIDTLLYDQAGRWLEDGRAIAEATGDSLLIRRSLTYNLRYLRQGGKYGEAISLCNDVIASCKEDDYLTIQQMYDQLTVLYQQTGDTEASLDAHAKYVVYAQKQMSQIEEEPKAAQKGITTLVLISALSVTAVVAAGFALAIRVSRKAASRKGKKKPSKDGNADITQRTLNLDSLTNREKEILNLCVEGKTSTDIARILSLSQRTVSNHKQNIYSKLGVNSNQELIRILTYSSKND